MQRYLCDLMRIECFYLCIAVWLAVRLIRKPRSDHSKGTFATGPQRVCDLLCPTSQFFSLFERQKHVKLESNHHLRGRSRSNSKAIIIQEATACEILNSECDYDLRGTSLSNCSGQEAGSLIYVYIYLYRYVYIYK